MRSKVGFLAFDPELARLVRDLSKEFINFATVVVAEMESLDAEAMLTSARALEKECEIIIARGGTIHQIAAHVAVPTLECPVVFSDVLDAVYHAKDQGRHLALIIFQSQDQQLTYWPAVLGVEVRKMLVSNLEEIFEAVKTAKRRGEVAVGGIVVAKYASLVGAKCQPIQSGRAIVADILQKAVDIAAAMRKERERAARLQALLDYAHEGVLLLGESGCIEFANNAAAETLKVPRETLIGKRLEEDMRLGSIAEVEKRREAGRGDPLVGKLVKAGDVSFMLNMAPVTLGEESVGKVITFFETSCLQSMEHSFRRQSSSRFMRAKFSIDDIIGASNAIKYAKQQAQVFARTDSTVLILGESGVGKELFAQSIHRRSKHKDGPFVPMNCAALPRDLMESELFGYEAGAFTDAQRKKPGLMEVADEGVLFLDEISSMPLDVQAKLLRAIEQKAFWRVGGTKLIKVDVQTLAASNRNLPRMVAEGQFREDLYYRLKVVDLHLPPLRERKADIPELVGFLVQKINARLGMNVTNISPRAMQALMDYDWPGNIRELSNAIERALLFCDDEAIDLSHLPLDITQ